MAESYSINTLLGSIRSGEWFGHSNRYKVFFGASRGVVHPDADVLCTAFEWPGKQILSVERRVGTSTTKIAYGFAVQDVSATFLVPLNGSTWKWLTDWQNAAVNGANRPGYHVPKYLSDYVADIEVYQLDREGRRTRGVRLLDAYPTTINSVQYGNANDGVVEMSCQFSYIRWYNIDSNGNETE